MTLNFLEMSGAEFQRSVRDDPDKWADAAMVAAEDRGYKIDRDWLCSLLADAMSAVAESHMRGTLDAMTAPPPPKYAALTGADFQRAVGNDPDKWADAFLEASATTGRKPDGEITLFPTRWLATKAERVAWVAMWFADAMAAAREGSIREVIRPAAST